MQVGDPSTEKLLLEACLELMATDAIVAAESVRELVAKSVAAYADTEPFIPDEPE